MRCDGDADADELRTQRGSRLSYEFEPEALDHELMMITRRQQRATAAFDAPRDAERCEWRHMSKCLVAPLECTQEASSIASSPCKRPRLLIGQLRRSCSGFLPAQLIHLPSANLGSGHVECTARQPNIFF